MHRPPCLRLAAAWLVLVIATQVARAAEPLNFIIVLADDMGYGDAGCFGAEKIRTPRLDRLASEGLKLTSFYTQPVCGPSRGALATGRYPNRIGGGWITHTDERTLAETLRDHGYATACFGKWDMSSRKYVPGQVPNDQGFLEYFGPLGANDSGTVRLWEQRDELEPSSDMGALTRLYTDRAIDFVERHQQGPFLLYLAHTMPHVIIGASDQFRGKSADGRYGDVIEEIDWNLGRLIDRVDELGLAERTVVLFTSDNGPWLIKGENAGSAGPLRDGKGTAWEGGFRVPTVVWGPGHVPAGAVSDALVASIDVLPTFAALAGVELPPDITFDGVDQSALLRGQTDQSAREEFLYHVRGELHAIRWRNWKLALPDRKQVVTFAIDDHVVERPELFDLQSDIGEQHDVAAEHPRIVARLLARAEEAKAELGNEQRPNATTKTRPAGKPAARAAR